MIVRATVLLVVLALSIVLQSQFAHRLEVHHARPDFPLVVLACSASLVGFPKSIWLGLLVGLLTASAGSSSYGAALVSRTIAGAAAGQLKVLIVRNSVFSAPVIAFVITLLCEITYNLIARNYHIKQLAVQLTGEVLYNVVLSIPVYSCLRFAGLGARRRSPFDS